MQLWRPIPKHSASYLPKYKRYAFFNFKTTDKTVCAYHIPNVYIHYDVRCQNTQQQTTISDN